MSQFIGAVFTSADPGMICQSGDVLGPQRIPSQLDPLMSANSFSGPRPLHYLLAHIFIHQIMVWVMSRSMKVVP